MSQRLKVFIDSAETGTVQDALQTGLASGVTTNPTLLKRARVAAATDLRDRIARWREAGAQHIFMQAWGADAGALEASGRWISQEGEAGMGVSVKLPATTAGFAAAHTLITEGARVLMTAVYTSEQAIVAAQMGAWGVAPYLGRLNNAGIDGAARIEEMVQVLEGESTGVLAASIRSPREVVDLRKRGVAWFTLNDAVLHGLVGSAFSDSDTAVFEADAAEFDSER